MFGDGISVALLSQDDSSHVRAFYKF